MRGPAQAKARTAPPAPAPVDPAPERPVARVLVDVPLAHLDRPFDYPVPALMHEQVVPGSRVKVRFAGQDVHGFVLERVDRSEHEGRLAPLRRAVSAEPVLSPAVARLSGLVAARYAGTRSDVLRLAVPSRARATEKRDSAPATEAAVDLAAAEQAWSRLRHRCVLRAPAGGGGGAPSGLVGAAGRLLAARCWRRPPRPPSRRGAGRCCACRTARTWPGSTPP